MAFSHPAEAVAVPPAQDLAQAEPVDGDVRRHDGTDGHPEGLYYFDADAGAWVKVSTADIGSSTTIGVSL